VGWDPNTTSAAHGSRGGEISAACGRRVREVMGSLAVIKAVSLAGMKTGQR